MEFNTTFNNISAISWQSVQWWRKPEYQDKTSNLPQVTDKLYHMHGLGLWCLTSLSTIFLLYRGQSVLLYEKSYHWIQLISYLTKQQRVFNI
jgi:hypothetical protein